MNFGCRVALSCPAPFELAFNSPENVATTIPRAVAAGTQPGPGCPCLVDMYYNDRSLHSVSFDSRGKLTGRLPGLAVALTIHEADQRDIVVNFDADQLVSRKF
jgi:hypothetical protein